MSFFGMGPTEFLVIAVIAFIIFGPEKFAELASSAGKFVREMRSMSGGLTGEFRDAMNEIQQVKGEIQGEFRNVTGEIQETTRSISSAIDIRPTLTDAMHPPANPPAYVRASAAAATGAPARPTKADPLADLGGLPEATPPSQPPSDLHANTQAASDEPRSDEPAA
jgi:sec-independent protein translocase protein TatB